MNGQETRPYESIEYEDLIPSGLKRAPIKATNGLDLKGVNTRGPSADDIVKYLRTLNFGLGNQAEDKWDCSERALWGIIHARHRFPGIAIGMAEGKGQVGSMAGRDHAVIIIWEREFKKYIYFDPLYPDINVYQFDSEPLRITAFPSGPDGQKDEIRPINKLDRIRDSNYVSYKTRYWLYPRKTSDRKGLLDYLSVPKYEISCIDLRGHQWIDGESFRKYWRDEDWAFWAYIHVRRVYEGCAIGVAYGDKADGKSTVVNVIWYRDGEEIKRLYWNPSPLERREVTDGFTPRKLFF